MAGAGLSFSGMSVIRTSVVRIIEAMEAAFARQRERRSKRGISSLRYFRAAVDAAWDERLRHLAGGGSPPADPPARTTSPSPERAG